MKERLSIVGVLSGCASLAAIVAVLISLRSCQISSRIQEEHDRHYIAFGKGELTKGDFPHRSVLEIEFRNYGFRPAHNLVIQTYVIESSLKYPPVGTDRSRIANAIHRGHTNAVSLILEFQKAAVIWKKAA